MKRCASLLFVPATEQMMTKAFSHSADAIIFDLEDSVRPEEKKPALTRLSDYLAGIRCRDNTSVYIRLNAGRTQYELKKLLDAGAQFDGIVIPKFEGPESIADLEYDGEILALIESPEGMIRLSEIAGDPAITMLLFGAEDYTSITGMVNREDLLLPLKLEIVKYARAFGKRCIDTICKEYKEEHVIRDSVSHSKELGFDGKLLIHPTQVAITNEVFSAADVEKKREILEAFERSTNGVLKYNEEIYERPHIEAIRRELEAYDQK